MGISKIASYLLIILVTKDLKQKSHIGGLQAELLDSGMMPFILGFYTSLHKLNKYLSWCSQIWMLQEIKCTDLVCELYT